MSVKLSLILIFNIALISYACEYDLFKYSTLDIYDINFTLRLKNTVCDCLSNILANSSDTSSNCNKIICSMECLASNLNAVKLIYF